MSFYLTSKKCFEVGDKWDILTSGYINWSYIWQSFPIKFVNIFPLIRAVRSTGWHIWSELTILSDWFLYHYLDYPLLFSNNKGLIPLLLLNTFSSIYVEGVQSDDRQKIANGFNSFFSGIAKTYHDKLPPMNDLKRIKDCEDFLKTNKNSKFLPK